MLCNLCNVGILLHIFMHFIYDPDLVIRETLLLLKNSTACLTLTSLFSISPKIHGVWKFHRMHTTTILTSVSSLSQFPHLPQISLSELIHFLSSIRVLSLVYKNNRTRPCAIIAVPFFKALYNF